MPAITVRNLPEETHRALKARAAAHGRSTEAEVRAILHDAVTEAEGDGLGSRIAQVSGEVGGFDLEITRGQAGRDPIVFS